jgi:deazaflavin-dependent oxidoreductase (nitroreductase family)
MRIARLGILPFAGVLEVVGRRTGKVSRLPLVVVRRRGERYLVSMLGPQANWVRNVEASAGRAVWEQGRRRHVRLEEVPLEDRAPILRRYLRVAWSARAHVAVPWNAKRPELASVAADYPVFRIVSA